MNKHHLKYFEKTALAFLLCFTIFITKNTSAQESSESDSLALSIIYIIYDGDDWNNNSGWTQTPVEQWYGINLENINNKRKVTDIIMPHNNIEGEIPGEFETVWDLITFLGLDILTDGITLFNIYTRLNEISSSDSPLGELRKIDISNNLFKGAVPGEITKARFLQYIDFSNNQFSGEIPADFANANDLVYIDLSNNDYEGEIPTFFGNMNNIEHIDLSENSFTGSMPVEICDATTLTYLNVASNELEGALSTNFEQLINLEWLNLSENDFSTFPSEIINIETLNHLEIQGNNTQGEFPSRESSLPPIKYADFCFNRFYEIPLLDFITDTIRCNNNFLTFEDFERNVDLIYAENPTFIYIPQNKFGRNYDTIANENHPFTLEILCGGQYNHYSWYKKDKNNVAQLIENAPDSPILHFDRIQLSDESSYYVEVVNDTIPDLTLVSEPVFIDVIENCMVHDSLLLIELYTQTNGATQWINNDNWLEGPVKSWYGINKTGPCEVYEIDLSDNNLVGSLPINIGQLQNLEKLNLNNNQLNGNIPSSVWDLYNLTELSLMNNNLNSTLDNKIEQLENLKILNLEANNITGTIPSNIDKLKNLEYLNIAHTNIEGEIPTDMRKLDNLKTLRLNNTALSGEIPSRLNQLENLETFEIQNNRFWGLIPDFSSINSLKLIDVSGNKFLFGGIDAAGIDTLNTQFNYWPQDTVLALDFVFDDKTLQVIDDNFENNFYTWFFNYSTSSLESNPTEIDETGTYYSLITNSYYPRLTLYSDTIDVTELPADETPLVPINLIVISSESNPNFVIPRIENYPDNQLIVFSKWGNIIYKTESYLNELDFSAYPEGTYYYVLNYTDINNKPVQIKNFIEVIKN